MLRRTMHRLTNPLRSERGITGLETVIVLIAFIVVASVFAYTVLTAGIFASQNSNEAVNAAIDEVRSYVTINGNTIAYKGSADVDGIPLDVTPSYQINATAKQLERSSTNSMVVNPLNGN